MLRRLILVVALIVPTAAVFSQSVSALTYTGCSSWRTVTNPWTGLLITPGSNQRYANLNTMDLSCADLSGVDFYGAVIGGVIWTKSNLTSTKFGGTSYCGGIFTGADIAGSNLKSTSTWSCAYRVDVYVNPTTTVLQTTTPPTATTAPTTTIPLISTTTTIAPNYYCLKIGGLGLAVRWLNSRDGRWADIRYRETPFPGVELLTLSEWQNKTNEQKYFLAMKEVALRPIPEAGCSSLDEQLIPTTTTTTTSTTIAPVPGGSPTTTSTTIAPVPGGSPKTTSTTTAPAPGGSPRSNSTTTTTIRSDSSASIPTTSKKCVPTTDLLFIYSYFLSGKVTNFGGKFDAASSRSIFDYSRNCLVSPITKILIETSYGVTSATSTSVSIDFNMKKSNCWRVARVSDVGQSAWSNQVCYTAPISGVAVPRSVKGVSAGATGAQCLDGYRTKNRTIKACSTHFGRDYWLYKSFSVGYSYTYKPKRSYSLFARDTGSATGRCVGICYGIPSKINGLPRNTYVSGYFRKDGTYVGPYTRSKP